MPDIVSEVSLPSQGLLYPDGVQWQNQLRAPRLKDRGLGDATRKYKLQASILDKTLVQPLGMSAYDLHTADFVYLNLRQRQLSKGGKPFDVRVKCSRETCGITHKVLVDASELEIKKLKEPPKLEFITSDEHVIAYTFVTPRITDSARDRAAEFKEEYPDTEYSLDVLETQEFLRLLIKTVDGKKLSYPQMTAFIEDLLLEDVQDFLVAVTTFDFGVQFRRSFTCSCGKTIVYDLPVG